MRRLLREPLLHFALLGALLHQLDAVITLRLPAPREPIVITADEVEALRQDWQRRMGRRPDGPELRALVDAAVDRQILFAEALRIGLDRHDPVVRERLLRNLRFVDAQEPAADAEQLLQRARALGMVRSDPVVRGRLAQLMQLRLEDLAEPPPPSLAGPAPASPRESFDQLYFADAQGAARQALTRLVAGEPAAGLPGQQAFARGQELRGLSPAQLAQQFGAEFAAALPTLPLQQWTGPLRSAYGWHLVWRLAPRQPPAAGEDLMAARLQARHAAGRQRLRAELERLRSRYTIRIEAAEFHS